MKWLLVMCFLLWARHGEGGALKCVPGSEDALCLKEQQQVEIEQQESVSETPAPSLEGLEAECLPGSEWESNCHSCRCSAEGSAECLKQTSCDTPDTDPIRCKPNTTFERDCNTCTCLGNGLGICTLKNCRRTPGTPDKVPSKADLPEGTDCEPGTEWKSGCNDCVCSPEGLRLCSSLRCPEGKESEPLLRCAPHSLWKKECNTCWCTSDGRAMCTRIGCVGIPSDMHFSDEEDGSEKLEIVESGEDHIERHSVCKPNTTFFVGCNPCHCNGDGTDFSCTNKPCPLPEDVEVFHELNALKSAIKPNINKKKVCVENRMFIMNCNTCWCNEDGTSYMCTRRVCAPDFPDDPTIDEAKPEKLRIIKRECQPDEVFEVDCNMCRCNPDGKSFSCTRRACVDEDAKNETLSRKARAAPQEPPKTCQPGQEFRMDCNKCLCDNEGQDFSCTRIDCNALNNNNNGGTRKKREISRKVPMKCAPGSVFDKDCNVCRCTEDGAHATCTLKRCSNKENNTVSTTESSFRCNPGEQFKESCNDCSCAADGKSVFCTLFICDEDLKP